MMTYLTEQRLNYLKSITAYESYSVVADALEATEIVGESDGNKTYFRLSGFDHLPKLRVIRFVREGVVDVIVD